MDRKTKRYPALRAKLSSIGSASIGTGYPLGSTANLTRLLPHLQVILETRRQGRTYGRTLTLPSIGANFVGFR